MAVLVNFYQEYVSVSIILIANAKYYIFDFIFFLVIHIYSNSLL